LGRVQEDHQGERLAASAESEELVLEAIAAAERFVDEQQRHWQCAQAMMLAGPQ